MQRDTNFLPREEFTRPRNKWPSGKTLLDRLSHFSQPMPNGCIEWTGAHTGTGRPFIKVGSRIWVVYRLIWIWHKGRIPDGLIVRHKACANKRCINIDHLEVGTHFDNAQDREVDGHTAKGENHYRALLTEDQVRDILLNKESLRSAAKRYGVGKTTIAHIRSGNTWKHLARQAPGVP